MVFVWNYIYLMNFLILLCCPSEDRLVQIMALNMYMIEEAKLRRDRSVLQDTALQLACDMFGIL